jgi:hypothetical protein
MAEKAAIGRPRAYGTARQPKREASHGTRLAKWPAARAHAHLSPHSSNRRALCRS